MSATTIGFDGRRDAFYLAEVTRLDGVFRVDRLLRETEPTARRDSWPDDSRIVLAVPDTSVMVKNLQVPASSPAPADPIVRFELAQSLLEDITEFQFQTVSTGQTGRYLGLVYRRASLKALTERLGLTSVDPGLVTFQARALALGHGYLAFCERAAGELIGLVDLCGDIASVCLLLQDSIVDLASVDIRGLDLDKETARKQFAIDLKTVVNFRRAALQDRGIGLPLSTVILSGERVDGRLRELVQGYFPGGVETPRFRLSLFHRDSGGNDVNPELWLTALGLAAN